MKVCKPKLSAKAPRTSKIPRKLRNKTLSDRRAARCGQLHHGEIMPSPTVVIAQSDPTIAMELANCLHAHFARVAVAESAMDLRTMLQRHEARVAVLDMELVDAEAVHQLARRFEDLTIICTHRAPDEPMWLAALNAGAAEFCHPQDIRSILRASRSGPSHQLAIAA
jgi:DNA-binding NtrC family response regulator